MQAITVKFQNQELLSLKAESELVGVLLAEACHSNWNNAGLNTTCNHHISITITDHSKSIADSMCTGCTSSADSMVWTLREQRRIWRLQGYWISITAVISVTHKAPVHQCQEHCMMTQITTGKKTYISMYTWKICKYGIHCCSQVAL